MNQYTPGQRWVSVTEPELGLGLITTCDHQRVTVLYPACGEQRIYARANAPLTRVSFVCGDTIESIKNIKIVVTKISEQAGLLVYYGDDEKGNETRLDELDLNHHLQFNKPEDRLFSGEMDPGSWFQLRYETWSHIQRLQQSKVSGLIGARTALIAHQLYIANEAANRYAPRIMLADEVGLGKTIEAGLIIHHRIYHKLSQRVLIIVPEALLHQWLVEMMRRFNLYFCIFDEQRCQEADNPNPFVTEQLILCSLSFFSQSKRRQEQALDVDWDLVIVDEAHHLKWKQGIASADYLFVEQLAQLSPGLLLLTATPEQLGKESHFARLRLLDPERFYNFEQFIKEEDNFEPVASSARHLLNHQNLDPEQIKSLKLLLKNDNIDTLLLNVFSTQSTVALRNELLNILLDHHGTGRVLFRNSRQTVKGFPKRVRYAYPLSEDLSESFLAINQDPRYLWLLEKLKELDNEKALLICQQQNTALELQQALKNQSHFRAAVFHEGMNIIERDRAAAYFADPESRAQLMICSEIGSEGRNFQFCRHLILFDLPENPDLLQQRIGRLDRIGQRHTIQIHIPYIHNSPQQVLFRWYDEGLGCFEANNSAAQQVYIQQLNELKALQNNFDECKLDDLIKQTIKLNKNIQHQLKNGKDILLELNSCRKEVAAKIQQQIINQEEQYPLWPYMEKLLDCYGVESEFHSTDSYILYPGNHMRVEHFPELPPDGVTVTVNRDIALSREDWQFLSWEHPMVGAAMDLVLSSDLGNAALSVVKHDQLSTGKFLLQVLFILECSAPANLQIGRFLAPTPISLFIDQDAKDLTEIFKNEILQEAEHQINMAQLSHFFIDQRALINSLLETVKHRAQKQLTTMVDAGIQRLIEVQGKEIQRLTRLMKINPSIKQHEIESLITDTKSAERYMLSAQLKLDAVRFIIAT